MVDRTRVALVTGASKSIGRGIALELAADGWDVFVNYNRDQTGAEETVGRIRDQGQRGWVLGGDVGFGDQVERMFERVAGEVGKLDLLVNNAAVQTWAPLMELKEADWDRTIRTNLKGTFLCTQAAAQLMLPDKAGVIINIGSGASQMGFPRLVDYSAAKGGISNLTRVSALELGPFGIRVNCVAPGAIEIARTRQEDPNYAQKWGAITPLRRVGFPMDVANTVVFLASDKAEFITGQTLFVDGGLFTQPNWAYDGD